MKKIFTTTVCALLMGAATADHLSDRLTFSARLSGAEQVPAAVTTNASGVAAMMLNSTRDTLWINIAVTGFGNNINGIHIHKGAKGVNGAVVVDFSSKLNKNVVRTFLSGTALTSNWVDLMNDNLYLNVHTTANPNGEIRGQIMLERDYGTGASLDGPQAGNATVTGMGTMSMGMTQRMDSLWIKVQTTGLSGKITAIHFHKAAPLQNGPVIFALDNFLKADSMGLLGGRDITASERDTLMKYIMLGQVYINVHTAAFPAGEIRGQVSGSGIRFEGALDVAQILAGGGSLSQSSTAWGTGFVEFNSNFTSLSVDMVVNGLSSTATAVHFHNAAPNASGGVVKNLNITNNHITGTWTTSDASQPLTPALISELLEGNIYVTVHTALNPNGEVRANMIRLAREGFICELDAQQASTTSAAMGAGIATYDAARTNLHYMMAVDGLSGAITSVHFHKAVKGASGAVLHDIGPDLSNNAANGYWDPFGNNNSISFRTNDSMYINIHTAANPNGEVRGQMIRDYRISSQTSTGIKESHAASFSMQVFPVPMGNETRIMLNGQHGEAMIAIYDVRGQKIYESSTQSGQAIINTSGFAHGFYFLKAMVNGETVIRKLAR